MKVNYLRKKHPKFIYEGHGFVFKEGDLHLSFNFKVPPDHEFKHVDVIENVEEHLLSSLNESALDNLVFHIGLIEAFSYWKAFCSPKIVVKAGFLNQEQVLWWKDLLLNGMGQYFYENKIDFTKEGFIEIQADGAREKENGFARADVSSNKILIPIGGGVDSAVTVEILTKGLKNSGGFIVFPGSNSSEQILNQAGISNRVVISGYIDKKLTSLNDKGYLNGHIPYTAKLHFLSLLGAYLFGYKNIAFSNERSSEEENIDYLGRKINHQYSKTYEFEKKFRQYNEKYLTNINVFSFLRPLYEIQITKIFSGMAQQFSIIRSCNAGQKDGVWCCSCSKCLSTFVLLYPFLDQEKIKLIFPENLFEKSNLTGILDSLVDEKELKPFECVGTKDEIKAALYLSVKKLSKDNLPYLLKYADKKYLKNKKNLEKLANALLTGWNGNHFLLSRYEKLLRNFYEK